MRTLNALAMLIAVALAPMHGATALAADFTSLAADAPTETVLIDEPHLFLYPGANWEQCVAVERGTLTVIASAAIGRTGETTHLLFHPNRQTARPDAYLAATLSDDQTMMVHTVEAGSYCYDVMVSHNLTNPLDATDPNRLERPFKWVSLKVISTS